MFWELLVGLFTGNFRFFTYYFDAGTDLWSDGVFLCFLGAIYCSWFAWLWEETDTEDTLVGRVLWAGGVALISWAVSFTVIWPVLNFALGFLFGPVRS